LIAATAGGGRRAASGPTASWGRFLVRLAAGHARLGHPVDVRRAATAAIRRLTPLGLSAELGQAHHLAAGACCALGELADATAAQHDAVQVYEALRPHQDVAATLALIVLGDLHRLGGEFDDAEAALGRALDGATETPALTRAQALNALGIVYKDTARYHDAFATYQQAMAIVVADGAAGDSDMATLWHNLAGLAQARGKATDALVAAHHAVALRTCAHGPDHRLVALDRAVRAAILIDLGRTDEARVDVDHALAVFRRRAPADRYEVAVNLSNLAACHLPDDPRRAATLHRQALEIKTSILGTEHPEIARQLHNLAHSTRASDDSSLADQLERRAYSIAVRTLPPGHPLIRICDRALGGREADTAT
jgi:tetratricopeptide (TPR) repeat protein